MGVREFFSWQTAALSFVWRVQMAVGVLVVLFGLLIALFPALLVALVSATTILIGLGLIGSAWRMKRLAETSRSVAYFETFEW